MRITNIVKFGFAALAMGAFFGVGLPVKAGQLVWVRAQQLDYFRARGTGAAGIVLAQGKPETCYHCGE